MNRTSILKQPNNTSYFDEVYKVQKKYQNDLIHGLSERELVWIGQHNLCYTIGRGGNMNNVKPSFEHERFKIFDIDRGGEVTCHMPGQLVIYLVLNLKNYKKDLDWYLRKIEKIIVSVLQYFDVVSSTKKGLTGVWCGDKKIASIGIGCKRWVTIHGFSINVNCDLNNFNKIVPCGIQDCSMTKLSYFNPKIEIFEVRNIVKKFIQAEFNIDFVSE